jgi:hypothetical protein
MPRRPAEAAHIGAFDMKKHEPTPAPPSHTAPAAQFQRAVPIASQRRIDPAQQQRSDMVSSSPRMLQLKALIDGVAASPRMAAQRMPAQAKANNTGLPIQLKSGVESLSGMRMDHVKVHYNSPQPAQLNAHAYAQGSDIHVGPGQEKHLPHEAWHVVQQAQGRVRPTMHMKGTVPVNDDKGLEHEADVMGRAAISAGQQAGAVQRLATTPAATGGIVQGEFKDSAELRRDGFITKALEFGLKQQAADELYDKSASDEPDPVTKLRTSADKNDSMSLAKDYAKKGAEGVHQDKVFYADIKFRNLAGLNAVKGHAGADELFGVMAECVQTALDGLKKAYKVQGYRHDGSGFGFMIVGNKDSLTEGVIETELKKAKQSWEQVKVKHKLADIANPKRQDSPGVELGYEVKQVDGNQAPKPKAHADDDGAANAAPDDGLAPELKHTGQGDAPGMFKGQAEERMEAFFQMAKALKLDDGQAKELYKLAGRSEKEALTGFDAASDRIGTLTKAMDFYKVQWPKAFAAYVEVDVRNLGGLNDNLTRGDSNNVFKFMSSTTDKHMRSLKADVVSFRHGGDEFSFVAVAKSGEVEIAGVSAVLGDAELAIDAYVQKKKIRQKEKKDFYIDALTEQQVKLLDEHTLPQEFEAPFMKEAVLRGKLAVETHTPGKLWRVKGSEAYWLIANLGTKFRATHIPVELTLCQILHSKDNPKKPRWPGTGIVWGASAVSKDDASPVDTIARADQAVEQKKK